MSQQQLPQGAFVSNSWSVINAKGNDITNNTNIVEIHKSGYAADIKFKQAGIFEVYCYFRLTSGETVATFWFEPVVE
ncbi:MAG: hypothetical protein ACI3Y2_07195 [Candidatus Egerieousia sp.]